MADVKHSALTQRLIEDGLRAKPPKREIRFDARGPWRLMARAEGYVMARRPHAMPRVFSARQWDALPTEQPGEAA